MRSAFRKASARPQPIQPRAIPSLARADGRRRGLHGLSRSGGLREAGGRSFCRAQPLSAGGHGSAGAASARRRLGKQRGIGAGVDAWASVHPPPFNTCSSADLLRICGLFVAKAFLRHVLSAGVACVGIGFALHGGDARALTVSVSVGGNTYNLTTLSGAYSGNVSLLQSQDWWGNSSLANQLATAVGGQLGAPNNASSFGPMFAYEYDSGYDFVVGPTYNTALSQVATDYYSGGQLTGFAIASSPSQVPGPLPLFGAMAGYGMSRRLRARIKAASPKRVVL